MLLKIGKAGRIGALHGVALCDAALQGILQTLLLFLQSGCGDGADAVQKKKEQARERGKGEKHRQSRRRYMRIAFKSIAVNTHVALHSQPMLNMIPIRGKITDIRTIPTIRERMMTSVGSRMEMMERIFCSVSLS